jgi:3-phosphoshikimate 1-carboxyvinyltransferase
MVSLIEGSEVKLLGLNQNSLQGDANLVNLFMDVGVSTEFIPDGVIIRHVKRRGKKFFHDFVNEPDLVQTFVVDCCLKNIKFLFSGVQSLKIKETDRIEALKTEMRKLGYVLRADELHMLEWDGERVDPQENPVISTYKDHRMAMSFAPACISIGSITIDEPEVVTKSYPEFWEDIKTAGFQIKESE